MNPIVTISGSPAARSRSAHLLHVAENALHAHGIPVRRIDVRELPAAALVHADFGDPDVRAALALVEEAQAVVIATPLYKASYSGLLKTFLDLLPRSALASKPVLPSPPAAALPICSRSTMR